MMVEPLLAGASISISDFKKNPSAAIAAAEGFPIAILNRNKPSAYLVPATAWAELVDRLEDADLAAIVRARADETPVAATLDEL
ncbi:type II toxin-antitoxin system Phd/YefM family antitoxin [Sphingomonas bacterium]|uniref:type II toxin-antitoxin system Phd/YefM family antitoxin n=1 Tax=Sphingomonas bacterium TaxID=1895847 RepID=UPI0020C5E00A|nr:type II toxin-antitoxin system prevent-host-death family antitoxin [Sphingomonas bacterium]